ncbi:MAG TPA: hypothetical protein VH373_00730 [Jatrophihabitantaceae bacterium]|jgi:quercetin dioxygenase-like cupin family protein
MSRSDHVESPRLTRRVVEIAAGSALALDAAPGPDAIVFVTAGEIDVECSSGASARFGTGAVLCFTRITVRALRNPGCEPARLLVIGRSGNCTG